MRTRARSHPTDVDRCQSAGSVSSGGVLFVAVMRTVIPPHCPCCISLPARQVAVARRPAHVPVPGDVRPSEYLFGAHLTPPRASDIHGNDLIMEFGVSGRGKVSLAWENADCRDLH